MISKYLNIALQKDKAFLFYLLIFTIPVSIWNVKILFWPIVVVFIFWFYLHYFNKITSYYRLDRLDLSLGLLFLYEIINYSFSTYKVNTINYIFDFVVIVCIAILFKYILDNYKYRIYFLMFISALSFLLTFVNIIGFFFVFFQTSIYGFDNFVQMRFLYYPMGFFSNEWTTILLCFLPFQLSLVFYILRVRSNTEGIYFLRKPIFIVWVFFALSILIFNIIISFSRGAYIALAFFVICFNLYFIFFNIFQTKRIIIGNCLFLLLMVLLVSPFYKPFVSTLSFSELTTQQRSTDSRLKNWSSAIEIYKTKPLLGIGSTNYSLKYNRYKDKEEDTNFIGRINSSFFQILVEKGIVGSILYLSLIISFIYHSHKCIINEKDIVIKTSAIIFLVAFFSILVREFTYSSIFYNRGILLLIILIMVYNTSQYSKIGFTLHKGLKIRNIVIVITLIGSIWFCCLFQENSMATSFYNQSVNYLKKNDFVNSEKLIVSAINLSPQNALFYSQRGLICVRKIESGSSLDIFVREPLHLKKGNNDLLEIKKGMKYYKKAIGLNADDDLFYYNLGYLYLMIDKKDSAFIYINKAIKIDQNNPLYHIALGRFFELSNSKKNKDEYIKALCLSPDIFDSKFYCDLTFRKPALSDSIKYAVANLLKAKVDYSNNPIYKARLAKALINIENYDAAFSILKDVTTELPNLNRPWYNLGYIYEMKGDYRKMKEYYNKSLFLSNNDCLPNYRLFIYYCNNNDFINAQHYKTTVIKYLHHQQTEHSMRVKWIYHFDGIENDIIPIELLESTKPFVDTIAINKRLQEMQNSN